MIANVILPAQVSLSVWFRKRFVATFLRDGWCDRIAIYLRQKTHPFLNKLRIFNKLNNLFNKKYVADISNTSLRND